MSLQFSDNILADLPKILDEHCGVFQAGKWRPYNNVAEFQARFPNVGVAETQMFWVRNPDNANNADLYALRKDKTPYKVLGDIDLTAVYNAIGNVLPYGLEGQIIKTTSDNTNTYMAYDPLIKGQYVSTTAELNAAKEVFVTQEDIFNKWFRFSNGGDPSNPSLSVLSNNIPGIPVQTNSWEYDTINNLIKSTFNTGSYIGFVSDQKLSQYTLQVTLSAIDADNDRIGGVACFVQDSDDLVPNTAYGLDPADFDWPIDVTSLTVPNQHSLSFIRARNGVNSDYSVYYDYGKLSEKLLAFSSVPWRTTNGWNGAEADIKIVRENDILTFTGTDFSDAPGGKGSLRFPLVVDLSTDPLLDKFRGACSFGFSANSQPNASFKNIEVTGGVNEIYDLRDGDVWVADTSGTYSIDVNRNVFDETPKLSYLFNPVTGVLYYLNADNTFDILNSPASTTKVILTSYNGSTINTDGNLELTTDDQDLVTGKALISTIVNGSPLKGADYWPVEGYVDNFGGFLNGDMSAPTNLTIQFTFI